MTDSETKTLERFRIEVSQVGTVDHIVDVDADSIDRSPYSQLPFRGRKLCDRGSRWPGDELVALPTYGDRFDIDKVAFAGDAPDEICSYCWSTVLEEIDEQARTDRTEVAERIGSVGYRLRWKQKGRAREEWYDILVRPDTTVAELDRLLARFSTLDDRHLRMYGLEDEYLDSTLNVIPDHQYAAVGDPSYTKASDVTIAEIAERARLWTGDRLSMIYDFGTPSRYYCIVKQVYRLEEIDDLLAESDTLARTKTAGIVNAKRP